MAIVAAIRTIICAFLCTFQHPAACLTFWLLGRHSGIRDGALRESWGRPLGAPAATPRLAACSARHVARTVAQPQLRRRCEPVAPPPCRAVRHGQTGGRGSGVPVRSRPQEQLLRRPVHRRHARPALAQAGAAEGALRLSAAPRPARRRAAFSCYMRSTQADKGSDCVRDFVAMQACLVRQPPSISVATASRSPCQGAGAAAC